MEPISYRASSAYYAQSEQFVLFPQSEHQLITLLEPQRQAELASFIAKQFRFGGGELTSDEMKAALLAAGKSGEWDSYESLSRIRDTARTSGDTSVQATMERELEKLVRRWTTSEPPLVPPRVELPAAVNLQLLQRSDYASRFDPSSWLSNMRRSIGGKLSAPPDGSRAKFVRFNHLDNDLAPKDVQAKSAQEVETQRLMGKLGMADLGLIREFDLWPVHPRIHARLADPDA